MDNKFHADPKLWDSLDDEGKKLLNESYEQHTKFVKKEDDAEYQKRLEQVREQTKQELEAQQKAKAERENALQSIPSAKRDFAGKLLDKGFSLDEIKQDNPEWFKPELPKADNKVFTDAVVAPHTGVSVSPSGKPDADLDAKLKLWKKNGMPENATDKDWEDWQTAKDKGLI